MASIWAQAKEMAAATPPARNRYVDFLRALSILVVITGHWLIAAFHFDGNEITLTDILALKPTIQWLTWIFQVMPIFFFVGGYANAVSLESSSAKQESYAAWLTGRLHRLVTPLLAVILVWGVLAFVFAQFGARVELVAIASQAALIPIWFLAIYIMVVILAPLTYRFWKAWGFKSLFVFLAIGALVDWLFFAMDMRIFNWSSYFWVWLSVHHFGYAWAEGRIGSPLKMLALSALGIGVLALLILPGPYPLAMVGSPDEVSNTLPPKMTLVALGVFQFGLAMALQAPMRRFLDRLHVWAATVLVNSMIMTVYLWHLTVMMVVVAVLYLLGGYGISILPDTTLWWETRPIWILVLYVALIPTALLFSIFERLPRSKDAPVPPAWRLIGGAALLCLGIALIAMFGFGGGPKYFGYGSFALVILGAAVSGLLPKFKFN